jgi:dihydroorotase-like cyclic amidohydrolase
VYVENGKIVNIVAVRLINGRFHDAETGVAVDGGARVLNFQHAVVSPGVVDVHVHLNEPGRADWEGELRFMRLFTSRHACLVACGTRACTCPA